MLKNWPIYKRCLKALCVYFWQKAPTLRNLYFVSFLSGIIRLMGWPSILIDFLRIERSLFSSRLKMSTGCEMKRHLWHLFKKRWTKLRSESEVWYVSEHKQRRALATYVDRKWIFRILEQWFCSNFGADLLHKSKCKFVSVKREKAFFFGWRASPQNAFA